MALVTQKSRAVNHSYSCLKFTKPLHAEFVGFQDLVLDQHYFNKRKENSVLKCKLRHSQTGGNLYLDLDLDAPWP